MHDLAARFVAALWFASRAIVECFSSRLSWASGYGGCDHAVLVCLPLVVLAGDRVELACFRRLRR